MAVIEPGTRIGGFEVQDMLGRGGMAAVYRATQLRLRRPVALKVLNPVLATDESFVQRFQTEGVNAARLDHPNIVPVYEAGEDTGYAFLAMKLVEGETLSSFLSRKGSLPAEEARGVLSDVAGALDYAHDMGFIHRDVKPGNVLLDARGHVYLSDFGLSKALGTSGLTNTGQWMGTAEYMAPEQAKGGDVDRRVDIYALGCMAFECLTGGPPYRADDLVVMLMAHATQEIPSATAVVPGLPSAVDDVIRRAMAKDPADRYDSALQVTDALAAALDGRRPNGTTSTVCPVCAHSVEPGDAHCENCGAPLHPSPGNGPATPARSTCPVCTGTIEPQDTFCGDCGSSLRWCRGCGGALVADDHFCEHCGTPVAS